MDINKRISLPVVLVATGATAAAVAARLYTAKRSGQNVAELLTEALLETEVLREAVRCLPDNSATALGHCADYLLRFTAASIEGVPLGLHLSSSQSSITKHHPHTQAVATVVTGANPPTLRLDYAVALPDGPEVRGTRTFGATRLSGLMPARPLTDTLQINLTGNYTVQMETEMDVYENLIGWQTRCKGTIVVRDNLGNVGRIQITPDGSLMGTITREGRIVGRVEGKMPSGFRFRPYELSAEEGSNR